MSMQEIGKLIDKWMEDKTFRTKLRKDPEGTLKATGTKLSSEEFAAFRKIDWKMNDEELKTKMNKWLA